MFSPRFAPAVLALAVFALFPTIVHNYRGLTIDDGLSVSVIPTELAGLASMPTARKAAWVQSTFAAHDWLERHYGIGAGQVRLFAARSYDAKRLYHHPELAVLRGMDPKPVGRAHLPGRSDVPIHVLTTSSRRRKGVAAYALLYKGRYVSSPILLQLKASPALLFAGRPPMTLLMASDLMGSETRLEEAPSVRVLAEAVVAFERAASNVSAR